MSNPNYQSIGRLGGLSTRSKHHPHEYAQKGLQAMNNLEKEVDPNGTLAPEERAARAQAAKRAQCIKAGLASGASRRRKAASRERAAARRRAGR